MMRPLFAWLLLLSIFTTVSPAQSTDSPAEKSEQPQAKSESSATVPASTLGGLRMRSIGPALMSGRIGDIVVDPRRPNTWYVAASSGNIWKTTNSGTTWTPIFERYGSYSIGCLTLDPQNSNTLWVGTGENDGGRHIGFGDGIYVSRDGGKSFKNMGLKKSEHLSKIIVHPRNPNSLLVASQGPLWSAGGERGVYRSTDGGKTWSCVLSKGEWTGATDLAIDPVNPQIVYAALHQRHRTVAALVNGGPESGIYKSTDGGKTWRELKNGLPGADKGKIALVVSPQKPEVVYASIELAGREGGTWRSTDRGESWTKMGDYLSGGTGPHYYQEMWADPHRFDVLYHANVQLGRSEDGGATWESVEGRWKHVDNHAVAFHPTDPDFLLVGCDGGVYRSYDYARTYQFCANLPLTQFYKLSLDNDLPFYHVVGGTQDNYSQYGPVRTGHESGIANRDWITPIGGDGHDNAIDPEDPNTIYCESQQGYLRRYDRRTGTSVDIRPQPAAGEEDLRFNWDSPILISPHSHTRLYFGSRKLHRSDNRGDSWTTISPDLSRQKDRFLLPMMGRIWSIDALWDLYAMSQFGNITSISESPVEEGLLYVGTDDGLIHVSEDGGENWRRVEKIYGVPEFAFVNDIKADLHDADTVYATLDNHKEGDYRPFVIRSRDRGRTWESMNGDLPERHLTWRIIQDHVKPELFFLATEFGIFVTLDDGEQWIPLKGGVPVIPFRDLEIQRREDDLVGASFGRGFYVLDDYSPLRHLDAQQLQSSELVLFPVRKARLYIPARVLGGAKGFQGDGYYTADNPPFGAVITYHLKDSLKTQKQRRAEAESKKKQAGQDNPYPGFDSLKAEERESAPRVTLTIEDSSGNVVNRLSGSTSKGLHRIAWNLRYAGDRAGSTMGPFVLPGTYTVRVSKEVNGEVTALGEPQQIEVVAIGNPTLPQPAKDQILAFQMQSGKLRNLLMVAANRIQTMQEQLDEMETAVRQARQGTPEQLQQLTQLRTALLDVSDELTGNTTITSRDTTTLLSIMDRASTAYRGSLSSMYGPTETHRQQYQIAAEAWEKLRPTIEKLLEQDLPALKKQLDQAGVPWTSGRAIPALGGVR